MPLILHPPTASPSVRERLADVRARLRRMTLAAGIADLACAALLVLLMAGAIDRLADAPSLVRAAVLIGLLAAGLVLIDRRILRPLRGLRGDLTVALRAEERFGEFNDALASALEFESSAAGSQALRAATARRAARIAEHCDFRDLLDPRPVRRSVFAAAALSVAATSMLIAAPTSFGTAAVRLLDPFGGHAWPPSTQLTVTAPDRLARGEPLTVRGELHGVIPDRIEFRLAVSNSATGEQSLAVAVDETTGSFQVRVEANRLPRSFRFRVIANDADTGWRPVALVVPPQLTDRDGRQSPQVRVEEPAYSDLPPRDLPDGSGLIDCVVGATVRLRARVDRPVEAAWVEHSPDPPTVIAASAAAALGSAIVSEALGCAAVAESAFGPQYAAIDADRTQFEIRLIPRVSGRHVVYFRDAEGLTGRHECEIRLARDPAPEVQLESPNSGDTILSVLPDAVVPLRARVDDRMFAIRSVWVEYRIAGESQTGELRMADARFAGRVAPALLTLLPMPAARLRPHALIADARLELAAVRHSDRSPLRDGDVLTLSVAADDFDDVTVMKSPGRSHEIELQVVSPARLAGMIQKSHSDIQRELAVILGLQREARNLADSVSRQDSLPVEPHADNRERLIQSENAQRQVRQRIGVDDDGLRAAVRRLQRTYRNNPLAATPERARIESLDSELERIDREVLQLIPPLLATARTEREASGQTAAPTATMLRATRLQAEAERFLRDWTERMQRWSDSRELRAEAGLFENEQTRIAQQREQFESQQGVRGTSFDRLTAEQRDALERLGARQLGLAERTNDLLRKTEKLIAEKRAESAAKSAEADRLSSGDTASARSRAAQREQAQAAAAESEREAQALERARGVLQGESSLSAQLRRAADDLTANKLGEAKAAHEKAIDRLRRIQNALSESDASSSDRLAKRARAAAEELNEIVDEQERLQKKAGELSRRGDSPEVKEALERLAREQSDLRERTDELAERLARDHGDAAASDLRMASRNMERAGEQLQQGESADRKLDDALDRLDDAEQTVERLKKELDTHLQRESQMRLMEALKGFRERQRSLGAETDRVFRNVEKQREWERSQEQSLIDAGRAEKSLAAEIERFGDGQAGSHKVLAHALRDASAAMNQAEAAIGAVRDGPMDIASLAADRESVAAPQRRALARLHHMIDVLDQSLKNSDEPGAAKSNDNRGSDGTPSDRPTRIAELKLLRAMQQDLNERTAALAREHPDPKKWTQVQRDELESIQRSQAGLASLLEELQDGAKPQEVK